MNIAVIFAGGVGIRMKTNGTPKQFLEINEVPVIIHTLKVFEDSNYIDAIVIACLEEYIEYLKKLIKKFKIKKVRLVVKGGETGQLSIINGIKGAKKISKSKDDIVLIHDGVRPIIDDELIFANIENTKKYGTSISCLQQRETTIISKSHSNVEEITKRDDTFVARAPQCFFLNEILEAENIAIKNNDTNCIDSCTVMKKYGKHKLPHITECKNDNIKITTPEDYFIAKALLEQKKNKEVWGLK